MEAEKLEELDFPVKLKPVESFKIRIKVKKIHIDLIWINNKK